MNIAFISYWTCPKARLGVLSAGGLNVYVLHLANELGNLGQSVDIFTRSHKYEDEKIVHIHKNVNIIHLPQTKKDLYQDTNYFADKIIDYSQKINRKYDILHSHYFYSALVGKILRQKYSLPLLHTFHALGIRKKLQLGIVDEKRIKTEKSITQEVDGIIASTPFEKHDLINKYNGNLSNIYIVHPGVNHGIFKPFDKIKSRTKLKLPKNKKIILFVGRIDPIKGIHTLIHAIDRLVNKHSGLEEKIEVDLIGGDIKSTHFWQDPEVTNIIKHIKSLDLECCIKFLGSMPHHMLPFYYSAADIVAAPSMYESFGLVVLEALTCGSVVVASKEGGLKLLIKDKMNGRLFPSQDFKKLASLLWELLNDTKQRIRLSKEARKTSLDYCWDKQAKKMLTVYKKFV